MKFWYGLGTACLMWMILLLQACDCGDAQKEILNNLKGTDYCLVFFNCIDREESSGSVSFGVTPPGGTVSGSHKGGLEVSYSIVPCAKIQPVTIIPVSPGHSTAGGAVTDTPTPSTGSHSSTTPTTGSAPTTASGTTPGGHPGVVTPGPTPNKPLPRRVSMSFEHFKGDSSAMVHANVNGKPAAFERDREADSTVATSLGGTWTSFTLPDAEEFMMGGERNSVVFQSEREDSFDLTPNGVALPTTWPGRVAVKVDEGDWIVGTPSQAIRYDKVLVCLALATKAEVSEMPEANTGAVKAGQSLVISQMDLKSSVKLPMAFTVKATLTSGDKTFLTSVLAKPKLGAFGLSTLRDLQVHLEDVPAGQYTLSVAAVSSLGLKLGGQTVPLYIQP